MYQQSNESQRPLAYGNEDHGGVYTPPEKPSGRKKWVIAVPIILLVLAGIGVGVYFALKDKNDGESKSSNGKGGSNNGNENIDPENLERFAVTTDSWGIPVYPSMTNTALFGEPTFAELSADKEWPADDFVPANPPSFETLRPHPRIIAPSYKWDALSKLMENDFYLSGWHEVIMANATAFAALPVVAHVFDGGPSGSGILDPAREIKSRMKHFAYAYRMSQDTKWVDRAWRELENAAGLGTEPFGDEGDRWNTPHFLDVAEMTAAFAVAYDWMYDAWQPAQRDAIREAIITNGLSHGLQALSPEGAPFGWWKDASINGNWNCVCNGGMILGALAIIEDDTTGTAAEILPLAVASAQGGCSSGPSSDGTWSETPNYWYFGTTGHAELTSTLLTATGSDFNMLTANPGYELTGLFHMYVTGTTSMFEYGDHGPNKFSATANSLIFYGSAFNRPVYTLYQRDRRDAAEPWSMFWYDPSVEGAFWNGLPLDHAFEDPTDTWMSMRSSWTDNDGMYVGFKCGALLNHQAHGDLDAGTFVIDALDERWAGEHGNANYLGLNYFSNETQASGRWLIYRKMTEGQNVISINGQNQDVSAVPTMLWGSSETEQGDSTVLEVPDDSTAYAVADLASAYFGAAVKRGIRFINGRRQVLLQDELDVDEPSQWRVQTNATITINDPATTATLELNGKRLHVAILEGPSGVAFQDLPSQRTANAPQLAPGQEDEDNSPARVLAIDIPAGATTLVVAFNPEWEDFDDFQSPGTVALDSWTLSSHD